MRSRFTFLLGLCFALVFQAQNRQIDSLIQVSNNKNLHDTIKLKIFGDISWELLSSDINQSLFYAQKELELSKKYKRIPDIAQSESDLGNIYNRKAIFDTALIHYYRALRLREQLGQDEKAAGVCVNIATVLMRQTKFKEALELNFKSLKLFEKVGNISKQANVLGNIGNIYNQLNQTDFALNFFRKGLVLVKNQKLPTIEGNLFVNIGGLKFATSTRDSLITNILELDSSLFYFKEAEKIFTAINARYNLAAVYNDIGKIYLQQNKLSLAADYYQRGLQSRVELDDKYGIGLSYLNLGEVYFLQKDYSRSIEFLKKSAEILKELNNLISLRDVYFRLSRVYEAKKEYEKCIEYYGLYAQCNQMIYTNENAGKLAEMQTKYETEKKDLEIAKQKAELESKEKQVIIRNSVIIFGLLLTFFIAIAFYFYNRKKQIQQKAELDAELAAQKDIRSKAIIEAEEKERIRIAKDLHDGVGQLLSAAKLNLSNLESNLVNLSTEQDLAFKNALSLVDDSVKQVRLVSHNMMPNTLLKQGLASAVREFITKIQNTPNLKVNLEMVGLNQRLEQEKESVLYRVIQELVANIIKHAKATQLTLQIIKHENELTIMVEDDGVGFDPLKLNTFEGIGIRNIISRVEFINGEIHFDTQPGKGTRVIIDIPV